MMLDDDFYSDAEEWVEAVYRLLAEGQVASAMEAFRLRFPALRDPAHEKRLAARITAGRQMELTP